MRSPLLDRPRAEVQAAERFALQSTTMLTVPGPTGVRRHGVAGRLPGVVTVESSGSLVGGTGEAFRHAFHTPGFVVVQPSEGDPAAPARPSAAWSRRRCRCPPSGPRRGPWASRWAAGLSTWR